MAGKSRPSLRAKTLQNVASSNLSLTDKKCIESVFAKFDALSQADVVEVVRCEKCKYLQHTNNHIPYCEMWDEKTGGIYTHCIHEVSYDGFCSYGVRKDDSK